jgi:adenylate cyclase, class 2
MHYEVEQKFRLPDPAALTAKLTALGAKGAGHCEQADLYFNHPARDFAQTDEALRIRQVDGRTLITYKGPKIDRQTKTRREIELPLGDSATTADDFGELLTALGFVPVAQVRKRRSNYHLSWQGHDVEVSRDEVEGLGDFIELEIQAGDDALDAARQALVELAACLELGGSERRSYLELLVEAH